MSARPEHPADAALHPTAINIFRLRCEARAELYAACLMDFYEAVDGLQAAAVASGLVAEIGQDEVQRHMAEAFAGVREIAANPQSSDATTPWDSPGWQEAVTKYHEDRDGRVLIVEVEPEEFARARQTIDGKGLPKTGPDGTAESTLNTAAWLAFQVKDAKRWRGWLDQRSPTERADIVEHLTNIKQQRRRAA
jgi:hypothetical protein